jgi:polysaccharide export outer membrane protein
MLLTHTWRHLLLAPLTSLLFSSCLLMASVHGVEAAAAGDYRLSPGDVVEVTVTPQSSFGRTVTIQPDGKISYPLVGTLQAAGLTVAQLSERLRRALDRDLVGPRVTASLKEMQRTPLGRVSVLGAVRVPGSYEIKGGTTLAEVLASAGGPTSSADLRRVTITRADQSVRTIDLSQTEKTGRLERNTVLQAGDFIVVPEGTPSTVMLLGEVAKPGSYEIRGEMRALDVIMQAGGPTAKADMRRVALRREGAVEPLLLNLQPLVRADSAAPEPSSSPPSAARPVSAPSPVPVDPEANARVRPGDTITIPETDQRVYVFGRVTKPGLYPYKSTDRLLDALALADGPGPNADLSKVVLVRRGPTGEPVSRQIDVKQIVSKGKLGQNELLQPGDVVYVSDKKQKRSIGDFSSLIWSVTGLATLFRL